MFDLPDRFRRVQAGNERALADLIAEFTPRVRGYVRRQWPHHDAEEVVQEVWVRLWRRAADLGFDDRFRLEAWLLSTARYVALELWSHSHEADLPTDDRAACDPGVEEIDHRDDRRAVRRAMDRLGRDDQVLFYLACYLEWSHDQIVTSGLIEVRDAGQSRQRLFQARLRLIQELGRAAPQLAERLFGPA